ncbi:MAG: signal peptidase II [Deltaproteobacteria bacterium]|nr:signal peptidase II [Deltaproteobacteria bacterium]
MNRNTVLVVTSLAVVLLDQVSKLAVVHLIPLHGAVTVIPGFFDLVHIRNRGMAFGILNRPDANPAYYLLVGATLAAVILLLFWFRKTAGSNPRAGFGLSLIIGGAVGNLIDRIRLREVIDFLDVYAGSFHWPAFNVADSAITVGSIWLAVVLLRDGASEGSGEA